MTETIKLSADRKEALEGAMDEYATACSEEKTAKERKKEILENTVDQFPDINKNYITDLLNFFADPKKVEKAERSANSLDLYESITDDSESTDE